MAFSFFCNSWGEKKITQIMSYTYTHTNIRVCVCVRKFKEQSSYKKGIFWQLFHDLDFKALNAFPHFPAAF